MCMEDIRLGRKKFARVQSFRLPAAGVFAIPADPDRVSITFGASGLTDLVISDKPDAGALSQLTISVAASPKVTTFTVEDHGSFVTGQIFCFGAANDPYQYLEVSLSER